MSLYHKRLLAEGIRIIEGAIPSASFNADYSSLSFQQALDKRTQLADLRYQVSPIFTHFKRLLKLFSGLMAALFFVLGATSVTQLLVTDNGAQINFFWAIILFIAPNILSLLIWLLLYSKRRYFSRGWLADVSLSVIGLLDTWHHKIAIKHPHYASLFQYYFKHRLGAYMGRAQLSLISHLWWSSYLFGATLALLLVLATHQVDFIWQTTILNENTFLWFTQQLTYLPEALGMNVPNPTDISSASISMINSLDVAQHNRVSWANLLIFSLCIYALLPRFILLLLFYRSVHQKQNNFKLNLTLPYYLQLKNIVQPLVSAQFIEDADLQSVESTSPSNRINVSYNEKMILPANAYPLAIELDAARFQQAASHVVAHYANQLVNAVDNQTQQIALSELARTQQQQILLYVDLSRLPDRGCLRLLKKCHYKTNVDIFLILLGQSAIGENPYLLSRLQNWMEMAEQAHISPDRITYLFNSEVNYEA